MKHFLLLKLFMCAALACVATGCAHQAGHGTQSGLGRADVSFPHLRLDQEEYVQSICLEIREGRIVSVNRLLEDWDMELVWDNPGLLNLKLVARHFGAGLSDLRSLDGFITVESNDGGSFALKARLHTESTGRTGRGDKEYAVSHIGFILNPVQQPTRSHQ